MQAILENLMEFARSSVIDWCGSQNAAVVLKEALTTTNFIKGTMSPHVHAQVDEKHFEIVGSTFSNTVREFRRLLYRIGCKCKCISTGFEKLSIFYGK